MVKVAHILPGDHLEVTHQKNVVTGQFLKHQVQRDTIGPVCGRVARTVYVSLVKQVVDKDFDAASAQETQIFKKLLLDGQIHAVPAVDGHFMEDPVIGYRLFGDFGDLVVLVGVIHDDVCFFENGPGQVGIDPVFGPSVTFLFTGVFSPLLSISRKA